MCTLACWISVFDDAPLVVAANRDERLDRASSGPEIRGVPPLLAPRDELAGGTWWALSPSGFFVGLTNRASAYLDAGRTSRGLLVEDIARTGSTDAAERRLRSLRPDAFNGFHLLATDGRSGVRAICDGRSMAITRVGPGLQLLTERSFGAEPPAREAFVRDAFGPLAGGEVPIEVLSKALAAHSDVAIESACVHLDEYHYGTRSSTLLALGPARRVLLFADGPPCATPLEDLSPLLGALARVP